MSLCPHDNIPSHCATCREDAPRDKRARLLQLLTRLDEHAAQCRKVQAENEDKGLNSTADIYRVMANCHEQDADLLRSALSAPSHEAPPALCDCEVVNYYGKPGYRCKRTTPEGKEGCRLVAPSSTRTPDQREQAPAVTGAGGAMPATTPAPTNLSGKLRSNAAFLEQCFGDGFTPKEIAAVTVNMREAAAALWRFESP